MGKINIMYGAIDMQSVGFSTIYTWVHNDRLKMSKDDQLKHNKANIKGFQERQVIPPQVTIKSA